MRALPLLAVLALTVLALAGCGSSRHAAPGLADATARTTAAGTARFTLSVTGAIGGVDVSASENGTVAFTRRRAHIYKLVLGGGLPQEVVIDGPFTYTNGDVEAAMNDPTVKPWTKLDTRRLPAKQRLDSPDELAHVRAAAFLADGVADPKLVGGGPDHTTHYSGTVDPVRLAARLPAGLRRSIAATVRNDYAAGRFAADFWVDPTGRLTHVHVAYSTSATGRIVVDETFSDYGAPVVLGLPPAREIQDISP